MEELSLAWMVGDRRMDEFHVAQRVQLNVAPEALSVVGHRLEGEQRARRLARPAKTG